MQHYKTGNIEAIDVIEDWQLGFHLGNAIKYIARAKHKGSEQEDLEKAAWYLRRDITFSFGAPNAASPVPENAEHVQAKPSIQPLAGAPYEFTGTPRNDQKCGHWNDLKRRKAQEVRETR